MAARGKKKKPGYSEAMEELERIVNDIEGENIDVDHLTEKVSRARELLELCRERLKEAEEGVKKVLGGAEAKTGAPDIAPDIADEAQDEPDDEPEPQGSEGLF